MIFGKFIQLFAGAEISPNRRGFLNTNPYLIGLIYTSRCQHQVREGLRIGAKQLVENDLLVAPQGFLSSNNNELKAKITQISSFLSTKKLIFSFEFPRIARCFYRASLDAFGLRPGGISCAPLPFLNRNLSFHRVTSEEPTTHPQTMKRTLAFSMSALA